MPYYSHVLSRNRKIVKSFLLPLQSLDSCVSYEFSNVMLMNILGKSVLVFIIWHLDNQDAVTLASQEKKNEAHINLTSWLHLSGYRKNIIFKFSTHAIYVRKQRIKFEISKNGQDFGAMTFEVGGQSVQLCVKPIGNNCTDKEKLMTSVIGSSIGRVPTTVNFSDIH